MGLFTGTQQQYYNNNQSFTVNAAIVSSRVITLTFLPLPASILEFKVFVNGSEVSSTTYDTTPYNSSTGVITFDVAPTLNDVIVIEQINSNELGGNYQYIGINNIVNNFIISYVGMDKIINKVKRTDIYFHAQRALAEMSYDTLRSNKSQEIEVPPSLLMTLPHDYVNYIKLSWLDNSGIERLILPARKTSNPRALLQDSDYNYLFDSESNELLEAKNSDTFESFKNSSAVNTTNINNGKDIDATFFLGGRYGIDPEYASTNGLFFIDDIKGIIHFSSNINGKTVTLKYLSDTLGTDGEMQIHKFAEEAMYKWIAHAILATKANVPEYIIARFKKERFAEIRKAKLRLSNFKLEELTQIMRGKSKQIKH